LPEWGKKEKNMKNNIFMRLMSAKSIEGIEDKYPFDKKLDMVVGYRVLNQNEDGATVSSPLTNTALEESGVKREDLYDLALKNTSEIFKPELYALEALVRRICDGTPAINLMEERVLDLSEIYVLTNQSGMFGAAVMLQSQTLNKICERLGCPIYVLPSSIHEIIIVPKINAYDLKMLSETVKGVNETVVNEADFLSDSVYEYTVGGELRLADREEVPATAI
jgi:hypothetical protein